MKNVIEKIKEAAVHLPELLLVFISPAATQIGIISLAIVADTSTAIWAAKKRGEPISSKKAAAVIPKMVVYALLIILAHTIGLIFEIKQALTLISVALIAMELMSIDENFKKATGRGIFKPIINLIKRR